MLHNDKDLTKLLEWATDFCPNNPLRLDKKIVHKSDDRNVCVSRIEKLNDLSDDQFIFQVAVDTKHPFFFEHPYDHIPGMLVIEAGRQIGTAISHLFYNVPYDTAFILKDLHSKFYNYAEISKPLFGLSSVSNKKFRKNQLIEMETEGVFIQNGEKVAYMKGIWNIYKKAILKRMRQSKFTSASQ